MDVDNDDLYEVEKILGMRDNDGERQYLVRWKGFTTDEDTWEPEKNLQGCEELIEACTRQHGAFDVSLGTNGRSSKQEALLPWRSNLNDETSNLNVETHLMARGSMELHSSRTETFTTVSGSQVAYKSTGASAETWKEVMHGTPGGAGNGGKISVLQTFYVPQFFRMTAPLLLVYGGMLIGIAIFVQWFDSIFGTTNNKTTTTLPL